MIIRPAIIGNARPITEIHVESWQAAYRGLIPDEVLDALSAEQREAMWGKLIIAGRPSLLVAETFGQVVGFSAFGPCQDKRQESA